MIEIKNDPFKRIINIVEEKYGDVAVDVHFVDGLEDKEGNEVFGLIAFPEGNSKEVKRPKIYISSVLPLDGLIEVFAHEISHLIAGYSKKDQHGKEWQDVFDWIHEKFLMYELGE